MDPAKLCSHPRANKAEVEILVMSLGGAKENSKEWWEARYQATSNSYLYSKEPSAFLMDHAHLFNSGGLVLDLASGEGRNAIPLALRNLKVIAIDFVEAAVQRAQELARASGSPASLTLKKSDLDFFLPELMTYDGIVAIDFRPAPSLLKNLVRGLKKDAFLIMENFLTPACLERKGLEVFETFKPGELLKAVSDSHPSIRIVYYSELGPEKNKAYLIAKKVDM